MNKAILPGTNHRLAAHYRPILVAILLIAAALRLYGLNNTSPPGLEHDEVAHWIINQDILAGNHGLYFAEAYGHEAGFHYLQTGFMVLLGDNALILRLPSAYAGLLLVAVSFALARRLFGLQSALLAAGLMAVLFWPVFYSRLALRAIALPLLSGLSAYFWWRGWLAQDRSTTESSQERMPSKRLGLPFRQRWRMHLAWFSLSGLLAGLTFYTYMASRAIPIFFLLFVLYLWLFERQGFRQNRAGVLLFFAAYAIVAAPLAIYLLSNSGVEYRISEVDAPLRALADGNLRPALENGLKIMAMFGFRGDPLWRQNVALLPVFDLITALFFTIGLLISLWRWRQTRYAFLILWLFTSAIPSILTIDAPSSIRIINALPVLGIFPVIGLEVIHLFNRLSTVSTKLSPVFRQNAAIGLLFLLFMLNIGRTWRSIFQIWPANREVQFVWQKALTDAAGYLDASGDDSPVAIGGWTPDTMDPPTMELTLRREDLSLRYFDPGRAVIIPDNGTSQPGDGIGGRIVHPSALPLHPALSKELASLGIDAQPLGTFTYYEVSGSVIDLFDIEPEASFGQEIALLSHDLRSSADSLELKTIWRVVRPTDGDRRIFFHLLDEAGNIAAQDDGLGAPAQHWQAGDIIIQHHAIKLPASPDHFEARVGVYDPQSGARLLTGEGAEFVTVGPAAVQ